eukprot:Em0004g803a
MFSRTVGDAFDETMDPYCFSDRHWIDDFRQWLAVDFPAIYTYLIDTPGGYTSQWHVGPTQLLAFGSIGVELVVLICIGFPILLTRLTQDGRAVVM